MGWNDDLEPRLVEQGSQRVDLGGRHHRQEIGNVVEDRGLAATAPLALVESGVRVLPENVGLARRTGSQHGHARGEGHGVRALARRRRAAGHRGAGAEAVGVGKEQRELVAADAEGAIVGPAVSKHAGHVREHLVAMPVSVTVVDELEVVEIHQGHRERLGPAHGEGHGQLELLLEGAVIAKIRQGSRVARFTTLRCRRANERPPTR